MTEYIFISLFLENSLNKYHRHCIFFTSTIFSFRLLPSLHISIDIFISIDNHYKYHFFILKKKQKREIVEEVEKWIWQQKETISRRKQRRNWTVGVFSVPNMKTPPISSTKLPIISSSLNPVSPHFPLFFFFFSFQINNSFSFLYLFRILLHHLSLWFYLFASVFVIICCYRDWIDFFFLGLSSYIGLILFGFFVS